MHPLFFITIFHFSLQSVHCFGFLREFFFPRHPILHRMKNSSRSFDEPGILDFIGLVESQGYPAEQHYLTTEDGYKLLIHRIPGSPKSSPRAGKPIVLLQHGIFASSDSWVLMGSQNDLAFILADEGYDVWVGNVRGNTYCRLHEELSTLDPEFWNFSYHEIGYHDLAAIIDYTLRVTGQQTIYYIGHSMGTTMSYVLLSTKPIYNEKIKLAVSLAPVAIWKIQPNNLLYAMFQANSNVIKRFFDKNEIYELFPQTDNNAKLIRGICGVNSITHNTCNTLIYSIAGAQPDHLNTTLLPYIGNYYPAGGSVQTLNHYSQNIHQGKFQPYNYGYSINYKIYGRKRPPVYDVKKITAPIILIYSENDPIVQPANVLELSNKLPNVAELYKIPNNKFNHIDYIWAREAKDLLYKRILDIFLKH